MQLQITPWFVKFEYFFQLIIIISIFSSQEDNLIPHGFTERRRDVRKCYGILLRFVICRNTIE